MALPAALRKELAMAARLLVGLRRFLRDPPSLEACRARLEKSLALRHGRFLELLRRGVYERRESPYLPLLRRAGISFGDVEQLLREHGLERTLAELYEAGVRVTLDEFKGRHPIRREGLEIATTDRAFDNPLLTRHYETQSSGSRGPGRRMAVDLEMLEIEACYDRLFFEDFGVTERPKILWRPIPPGSAGLKSALRLAHLGGSFERWFSQTPMSLRADPRHAIFTRAIVVASRAFGRALPWPEHVPVSDALTVARWLARSRAVHGPGYLSTTASCAVRVCVAALQHNLDIRDTFIRSSGEPLSPGKLNTIEAAGCVAHTHYGMAEVGRVGIACGRPAADDEVHLAADRVAVIQRKSGREQAEALWLTTLHWGVPRIMLNVELGDCAVVERRRCGCTWDRLGYADHLHAIRSYEKLTSEGMHFLGADLIALVEETLPARFGGTATGYQLVEEEHDGLTTVSLIVSPGVGPVDEAAVQRFALSALSSRDLGHHMMADIWRQSGTLRVVRREPSPIRRAPGRFKRCTWRSRQRASHDPYSYAAVSQDIVRGFGGRRLCGVRTARRRWNLASGHSRRLFRTAGLRRPAVTASSRAPQSARVSRAGNSLQRYRVVGSSTLDGSSGLRRRRPDQCLDRGRPRRPRTNGDGASGQSPSARRELRHLELPDLDGRRLAVHAESAVGTKMVRAYLAEECSAARPVTLIVAESTNRAASLLAGGIDAAAIELATLDWLEQEAPGRFHVLADFAARWPTIKTTGVQVNTSFAAAHPDIVIDYLRARLAANRDLTADPELLATRAAAALGPSDRWLHVARAHIAAGMWAQDGGLKAADVVRSLTFFNDETLTPALAPSVADLTFLEKALASP